MMPKVAAQSIQLSDMRNGEDVSVAFCTECGTVQIVQGEDLIEIEAADFWEVISACMQVDNFIEDFVAKLSKEMPEKEDSENVVRLDGKGLN